MAFTPEQKASIKKRAEELVAAEGISNGAAAQKAIKELFTPEQISAAFPTVPPPQPKPVSPVEETRPPEIIKVDTELEAAETKYRLNRREQLKEAGMTDEQAAEQIKKRTSVF